MRQDVNISNFQKLMKYLNILQVSLLYNMLNILIDGSAIQTQKQVSDTF